MKSNSIAGLFTRYFPQPGLRSASWIAVGSDALRPHLTVQQYDRLATLGTKNHLKAGIVGVLWCLAALTIALLIPNYSQMAWLRQLIGIVSLGMFANFYVMERLNTELRIVASLVELHWQLSQPDNEWPPNGRTIRHLNRRIRVVGREVLRLPVTLGSTHPIAAEAAARKSAAIQELQLWVLSPSPQTYGYHLRGVIVSDLRLILDGHWMNLPEAKTEIVAQGLSRTQRAVLVLVAIIAASGALWVGIDGQKLGAGGGLAISVLLAIAFAALVRSGVAPGGIQQAIDLSKGMQK